MYLPLIIYSESDDFQIHCLHKLLWQLHNLACLLLPLVLYSSSSTNSQNDPFELQIRLFLFSKAFNGSSVYPLSNLISYFSKISHLILVKLAFSLKHIRKALSKIFIISLMSGKFFPQIYSFLILFFSQKFQFLSCVRFLAIPWIAACQASQSTTNSRSLLELTYIKSVMPSNHLILCHPLLLLPSIFPSIRVFSNESVLCIRWSKYWSFTFSISPSNEYSGLISFRWTDWISLQFRGLSRVFSNTTVQKHQFFSAQLSLWSNSHIHTWLLEKP